MNTRTEEQASGLDKFVSGFFALLAILLRGALYLAICVPLVLFEPTIGTLVTIFFIILYMMQIADRLSKL